MLADVVIVDGLLHEVAVPDTRVDRGGCSVRPAEQPPAVELCDDASVELDLGIGPHHLEVEDQPTWPHRIDHPAQGVHDALRWNASERPREDHEIERPGFDLELLRRGNAE